MRRLHDWELIALHVAACLVIYTATAADTINKPFAVLLVVISGLATIRVSRDGSRAYNNWQYKRRKARQRKQSRIDFLGD